MRRTWAALASACLVSVSVAVADGPGDNVAANVRRMPPLGVEVAKADRDDLESGLAELDKAIADLAGKAAKDARVAELLPDVQIYAKAVRDALTYREFFTAKEVPKGKTLLKEGLARARALLAGESAWATKTGLVVRGYVSKIDGSVQPYGLVVPASYTDKTAGKYRLDVWFHGRGETLSEVNFLDERATRVGEFAPADTIVLHPYGRYCNANKFAGEVDAIEALESVSKRYRVDPDRVSVRGFSMGGASTWQFAVHYPDRWFAANPGAGFCETPRFLNVFQNEKLAPTWYEKKLWNLYDCDKVAANLLGLPVVAYSGELDGQKQAADVMAEALLKENVALTHVIGAKTKHAYNKPGRDEVESRLRALADLGRDRTPDAVHLATYTLKYNKNAWITIDAMQEHWTEARVDAEVGGGPEKPTITIKTRGVTGLTIEFAPGTSPLRPGATLGTVIVDEQPVITPPTNSDGSWRVRFSRGADYHWATWMEESQATGLAKRHDLQGPIDDAFMDSFLIVRPTGRARSPKLAAWSKAEMDRAIVQWRRQFRGEARVKNDVDVTDVDIANSNLILWGDPESNAVLKRVAGSLPIGWKDGDVVAGERKFPADHHALIAIYPDPLNPKKYVVLNSGFTFREYDYLNNARQTPKLPDWAVVDIDVPPDARFPGKVVAADFFGEAWELKPPHKD